MELSGGLIKAKDNGRAYITDHLQPIQPGGKNFSIDVAGLLRNGCRIKAVYDCRENK